MEGNTTMTRCTRCGGQLLDKDTICLTCAVVAASRLKFQKLVKTDDSWWVGLLIGFALACVIVRIIV